MDRETVFQLAREAGMTIYEGAQDRILYDGSLTDAFQRAMELVEQRTLERAAKVCEEISLEWAESKEPPAHVMAAAIRALKENHEP